LFISLINPSTFIGPNPFNTLGYYTKVVPEIGHEGSSATT
jgi:hypothetical protein